MERAIILKALRTSILENTNVRDGLFKDVDVPEKIDDIILAISSIDFADLLISVEKILGIQFAEECMNATRMSVGELAERIEKIV